MYRLAVILLFITILGSISLAGDPTKTDYANPSLGDITTTVPQSTLNHVVVVAGMPPGYELPVVTKPPP